MANTALPDRCWILTHREWKDDATRQTFEVIRREENARDYMRMSTGDPNAAESCGGFEIAEYRRVQHDAPFTRKSSEEP